MFRRARAAALKISLENSSAAPPRRVMQSPSPVTITSKSKSTRRFRPLSTPASGVASQPQDPQSSSSSEWDSPSLITALSKANTSNALLAGKAFFIATTLVGVGATALVLAVQSLTGTYTVPDFARRMRYWTNKYLGGITDRIHRAPESEEERRAALDVAPFGVGAEEWTWDDAEKRLRQAYDQGGFTLWAQVALREVETEARAERAKRQREIEAETSSYSRTS
ncbi:hypothetical protein P691DRAFT_806943 [Macrolepiota fuliginosa MF-IS2]|uniref:Uncharacterized protein n=1 Tax=Macrolepiota fuliginosa MF-IS2 TaxID=1400762 RepID=A0A9P6C0L8_9AGAR|nr:hypothetical protein P691DRAFT_806943 [Macrolepiota fuliginosa MF-IS2]